MSEKKYQLCPKCQGQGIVSKPPYVPGDIHEWGSTTATSFPCNVCQGAKIIAQPCESTAEQPVLPTFWDVAKAFKWAAEYSNEKGEALSLYEGQWTILGGDGDEAETEDLTHGNVAELYCLQKGFEKTEQPVREVDAEAFAKYLDEQRSGHTANMWAEKAIWDKPNAFQEWLKYFKQQKEK